MQKAHRRFRPTLWPTLFTVFGVAVLLGLGTWQIERLHWKRALIEAFETRVAAEPVTPPDLIDDIERWRYRRLAIEGRFLHDKELHLTGRTFEGSAGFHVVTPFRLEDGRILLVNRGWIPENRRSRASRPESLVAGRISLTGLLREDRRRGYFVPDNEPHNEVWLYVDTGQAANHRELGSVLPYYADAIRGPRPYRLPIGANTVLTVRNEHLQYAATWYLLALSLLVIYIIYHYQRPDTA